MIGIVRPSWRASSRAGFAAPVTVGHAAVAALRELRLRGDEVRVRAGREPGAEQRDEQRRERARRSRRAAGTLPGTGDAARRRRRATPARSPPHEIATSCAPRSTALDAIETVSSVLPEYDTAIASVSGPTNAGVRICFSTVIGTGSSSLNAAATTSPVIPEPPMPSTTMFRIVSPRGNASACTSPATSCACASCSGSPATAPRKSSVSVTARTWA